MIGVPGSEKSRVFSSSIRRRLFSTSGARRRRMPTFSRICGSAAYDRVHVVALFVGDHLERQLVVVAQEQRPLAVLGNVGRLVQDLGDRMAIFLPQRHEHARHQREVERHVAFVAVAEVRAHVGRPLVRLGEQHPVRVRGVERAAHPLQHRVRLRQVLAVRAFALEQVRHRVEAQRVDAEIEPELHHVDHRVDDGRVVEVEIRLVREEAMPVVLLRRPGRRSSSTSRCR